MNTQFSISELCMYMQLVDLLDEGRLPPSIGYEHLYRWTRRVLDEAHLWKASSKKKSSPTPIASSISTRTCR